MVPLAISRTATSYEVAPLEAFQLKAAELLDSVGPGPDDEPGLSPVGVAGLVSTDPGVWKYSSAAKVEHPAELQASTFQRYCLPAVRFAVYEFPVTT